MKLLILSDSHGASYNIELALRRHPDADAVFFLGDGVSDLQSRREAHPELAFFAVAGNCDIGASVAYGLRAAEEITLEGKRIFYCHGHTYSVKHGLDNIISAARSREADVVLFGHTHTPLERYIPEDEEGRALYLVNPGSIGGRGDDGKCSYAIITIQDGNVLISHGTV